MTGAAYVQRVREVIADEMATTLEPPRPATPLVRRRRDDGRRSLPPVVVVVAIVEGGGAVQCVQ